VIAAARDKDGYEKYAVNYLQLGCKLWINRLKATNYTNAATGGGQLGNNI